MGLITSGAINQHPVHGAERTKRGRAAEPLGLCQMGAGTLQFIPPVEHYSACQPGRRHLILRTAAQPVCPLQRPRGMILGGRKVPTGRERQGKFRFGANLHLPQVF